MSKLILCVCPDCDSWHGGLYATSLHYPSGLVVEEPRREDVERAMRILHDPLLQIVFLACIYCKQRGVKGISNFSIEELNHKLDQEGDDAA